MWFSSGSRFTMILFISVLGWGASGAAATTLIGCVCTIVFFIIIVRCKSQNLSMSFKNRAVQADELGQILSVGITAAVTNLASSISVMVMNQFLLT